MVSMPEVLILSEVEVLYLPGGDRDTCAALCRGDCLRWDWRATTKSCMLDQRKDTLGLRMEEEKMAERKVKPKRKVKPTRRTTKRVSRTTTTTMISSTITTTPTPTTTTTKKASIALSANKKAGSKKKPQVRKPTNKKKTLLSEEIPVVVLESDSDNENE